MLNSLALFLAGNCAKKNHIAGANLNGGSEDFRRNGVDLSGHYSPDWSEYVSVIGAISEPFAREFKQ